jgi:uncharacterized membrane protein
LLALINLAGVIALVVGLLVTVPVTSIAFANAYRCCQTGPACSPSLRTQS